MSSIELAKEIIEVLDAAEKHRDDNSAWFFASNLAWGGIRGMCEKVLEASREVKEE